MPEIKILDETPITIEETKTLLDKINIENIFMQVFFREY